MIEKNYINPKSSSIRIFIRKNFLSPYLFKTKKEAEKVLDLGCGWGFYFNINPKAYGIDIDKDCAEYLQKRGFKVVSGDISKKLPFDNEFFKTVIAHDVLEHFELKESQKIIKEAARVLEKNGLFIIAIPNKRGYFWGVEENAGHKHFINLNEILEAGKENFTLEKSYYFPLPKIISNLFIHNKQIIILRKFS